MNMLINKTIDIIKESINYAKFCSYDLFIIRTLRKSVFCVLYSHSSLIVKIDSVTYDFKNEKISRNNDKIC